MHGEAQPIRLELLFDGGAPTGRATAGDGATRGFAGWPGLMAAMEALAACAEARPNRHEEDNHE